MIFAAGLGTRLRPLTDMMPKALVPVGGKPLLQHAIEKLKTAGFDEIIINIHHFGEQIIDFVEANNHFGIRIEFSDEREILLDTGGGIKKAASFFNDDKPFLVHNVDILSNIDLHKLYEAHIHNHASFDSIARFSREPQPCSPLATLVCSERKTSRYLLFDDDNHLRGWINEATGETKSLLLDFNPHHYKKLAFAGIQILHPAIFKYMTNFPERFSIIDFYLSICDKETISYYVQDNLKLIDVGKIDFLQEATAFLDQHT